MSTKWMFPQEYQSILTPRETEGAIQRIRDYFQIQLSVTLNLRRVTAPILVRGGTGINDDLNGVEKPVRFVIQNGGQVEVEIVQSLAKWKRLALADLQMNPGEGLYADMNAIRPDEELDNLHSVYVDQWDWERVIRQQDRSIEFLEYVVRKIYRVIQETETYVHHQYPAISPLLPEEIAFLHAEDLLRRYPGMSPREREDEACREFGAVFVSGIGAPLSDGRPHDGRAPDYDDWTTPYGSGLGLNGDILVWYPVLGRALELSSMGIRVDAAALERQLRLTGTESRRSLEFHRRLLHGELPLSIGGGIGQSRLCLFYLRKAHIGEVQAGIWPEEMQVRCRERGIHLF